MYLVNCLTADAQEIQNQLYNLQQQSHQHHFPVKYLEFGNEFFMADYGPWFPNENPSITYMNKIQNAIRTARRLFPHVKIGVPFAYHFCPNPAHQQNVPPRARAWNQGIVQFEHLFDAVTIHEYSACTGSVDIPMYATLDEQKMALAAWGDGAIDQQRAFVASYLSSPKEIWQTEWNYATWMGVPLTDAADYSAAGVTNAPITGIFHASYLLKMIESNARTDGTLPYHTAGNHHLLNQQEGERWGTNCGLVDVAHNGQMAGTSINAAGQIFSHVAYVTLHLSDTMHTASANSHCGTSPVSLLMGVGATLNGLNCLYVTAHTHTCRRGALPIFLVINRCNHQVVTHIDTSSANSGRVRTTSYEGGHVAQWTPLSNLNNNYAHPWHNGPMSPTVTTASITPTAQFGQRIAVPAISFNVIEFSQPGYSSSHLAHGCPAIHF
jgi:hypothetical protein